VRVIEHTLIPLKDGTKLAARIWLPEDAEQNPVPAILEYLPYRKRDGTYERDALTHPYLAGHGYAGVRVDLRGSGDSTGLLFDEYATQEQDDGVEIIAWLAAHLARRGQPLQPGQWVLTGSIVTTKFPRQGDRLHFALEGLSAVEVQIA